MILDIAQIILGIAFFLFIPGWLIVSAYFKDNRLLDRIILAVIFSIMIGLIIGVFFGYDRAEASLTGGFTEKNIWLGELGATIVAALILLLKKKFKRKTVIPIKKKRKMRIKYVENLKKKKGLYQLVVRSIIFFSIILAFYLGIFLWFRHTQFFIEFLKISSDFYLPFLTGLRKTDFLNAGVFALIAFVLWNRTYLTKLKPFKIKWKPALMFAFFAVFSLFAHYFFKYWITLNPVIANGNLLFFTLFKQFLILMFIVFTAFTIYTQEFILALIKEKWKGILVFVAIGIAYFFLIQFFQLIWYQLSYFVTIVLKGMLSTTFSNVTFSPGNKIHGPRLGVDGFNVGISNECSGVDSLLLFLSLYALLFVLDWKRLDKKKMLILLIPGIIGTIAYNILRIYVLILVGIYVSPEFAVGIFHTNVGWILFLLFFMIFWHYGSKWVYKPKES